MSTKASTRAKRGKEGECRLTGEYGKYVKSHILPRALTRLTRNGEKIIESGIGKIPRRRPATWYDDELVIRKGEDILEAIDTSGIEALRKHTLIWSAFNNDKELSPELYTPFFDDGSGIRKVFVGDAKELRLFFLSIAWRAAASSRLEFKDVKLTSEEIEDIRKRVLCQNAGPAWEYPIILDQIVTRGEPHNRTPIRRDYDYPGAEGGEKISVPGIRIYMDGLVAQVALTKERDFSNNLSNLCLGVNKKTLVITRRFDGSLTHGHLRDIVLDNINRGYP